MQSATPVSSGKSVNKRSKSRRKNRRKRKNKHQEKRHQGNLNSDRQTTSQQSRLESNPGSDMWIRTYEKIVRWHTDHQMYYWKQIATNLKQENDELKLQLQNSNKTPLNDEESSYESSDSSDNESVDMEFLKFMEITEKHRADLKKEREEKTNLEDNLNVV